ncbi:MAG: hypothetical protein R3E02_12615 [Blastomonas sp.]
MRVNSAMIMMAALALGGCGPDAAETAAKPDDEAQVADAAAEPCPDDGPRLAGTGICQGRAVNYLAMAGGETPALPPGCSWTVNETPFATDYLLYRAAQCGDHVARLDFAGGAQSAELTLARSAIAPEMEPGMVFARVISSEPENPTANLEAWTRDTAIDFADRKNCRARKAGIEGWPDDALVVDNLDGSQPSSDGPRTACGPFGLDEDNPSFWRVFQGFSWFITMTQDLYQDIDPASLTLVTRDADGGWRQAE